MREKVMPSPLIETARDAPLWREWNTADVRRDERFAYYREGICQSYLAVTPILLDERDLDARIRSIRLDNSSLAAVDLTPHVLERTKRDLAQIPDDHPLTLNILLNGGVDVNIAQNMWRLRRGDVFLVDPIKSRHTGIGRDENCRMLSIALDRSIVANASKFATDGFAAMSDRPFNEAIISCLSLLAKRATVASREELNHLCDAAISLLAANMAQSEERPLFDSEATPTARLAMLTAIKHFVGQQIANPALSPALVAERFGISARYVHKIFEGNGETFGTNLLKLRLERIREDLTLPSNAQVSVGDIAHRWGFRDLTSFHRNFKLRFQTTPGILRSTLNRANRRTPQHMEKESGLSSMMI